jgi:hypothetical protein
MMTTMMTTRDNPVEVETEEEEDDHVVHAKPKLSYE